jgi:hypothetical protein
VNSLYDLGTISPVIVTIILIWSLIWKGLALWKAAKSDQRNWFLIMLVINTVGILEIAYLFFFAKKRMKLTEFKFWGTK